jgi:formamidopyrimidine-DNA glycosylase
MPELPEVESLRRDLAATIVGRTVRTVELTVPKLFASPSGLELGHLVGRQVLDLKRRAKLLIWEFDQDLTLVMHLKLTGQLVHFKASGEELAHGGHPVPSWGAPLPHKATHLTFTFDDDSILYMTDIRQFARFYLLHDSELTPFLKVQKYGPEPLTAKFTRAYLLEKLGRRGLPIKTVLLDQSMIAGIGNIYADESLWRSKIHPLRPASSLTREEVIRLHGAIRNVLDYAVREGVAFVPAGKAFSDRDFPYCHGREGQACFRCGKLILKDWVNARGTYWCPRCQKLEPRRRVIRSLEMEAAPSLA